MEVYEEHGQGCKGRNPVNYLALRHPAAGLCYYIGMLCFVFMFSHLMLKGILFFWIVLHAVWLMGGKTTWRHMRIYVIFSLLIALINPLFSHRGSHILFYLFDRPVTAEAALYGLGISMMILSMLLCFICLNQVLNSGKFLYLFSRIVPQTAFIISMSMRYFTLLKDRIGDYMGVQNTRDDKGDRDNKGDKVSRTGKTRVEKIKAAGGLLGGFSAWTLEDGMLVAESLRSKEYGKRKRTLYARYYFNAEDGIWVAILAALLIGAAILKSIGAGEIDYYRQISFALNGRWDMAAMAVMTAYLLLPQLGGMKLYIINAKLRLLQRCEANRINDLH